MAKAHEGKGTSFTPKTMLPVDDNTLALWHYDLDKKDAISGLSPIGRPLIADFRNNGHMGIKLTTERYLWYSHTVSGWVYIRSAPQWSRWFDFMSPAPRGWEGQGAMFSFNGNYGGFAYVQRGTGNAVVHVHEVSAPFPKNTWVYLTLTYDSSSSTSKVYYNGILQSSHKGNGVFNAPVTNDNWIGRSHWDTDGQVDGKFDGFTTWDHARTSTQIQEDMWVRERQGGWETDPSVTFHMAMIPLSSPYIGGTYTKPILPYDIDTHQSMVGYTNDMYSNAGTIWGRGHYYRGVTELTYGTYVESRTDFPRPAEGTIEFWMRPQAFGDFWNVFSTGNLNACFRVEISANSAPLSIISGDDSGNWTSCTVVPKGQSLGPSNEWIHVAFSWNNSNQLTAYLNGSLRGTFSIPYRPSNLYQIRIGTGYNFDITRSMTGQMADVRIWNTIRTQEQIKDCMHRSLSGNEEGLIRFWKLDEISGPTCYDSSPNKVNATIIGSYPQVRRIDKAPYSYMSRGLANAQIRREPATNHIIVSGSGGVTQYRTRPKFGASLAVGVQTTNLVSGGECDYELPQLAGQYVNQCQSVTLQNTYVYSGRRSLKLRGGIDVWGGSYRVGGWSVMNGFAMSGTYTFSAMIMVPRTEGNQHYNPATDFGLTFHTNIPVGVYGPSKFDEWQRVSLTWTVPQGTTFVMPSINFAGNANTGTWTEMYVDEVQIEALPYPTSFTPSSRERGQMIYENPLRGCNKGTISMWAKMEARAAAVGAYQAFPLVSYYREDDTLNVQPLFFGPTPEDSYFLWTKSVGENGASQKFVNYLPANWYDWHHYALTYDGPILKVYLNGQLVFTQNNFDHAEVRKAPVVFIGSEKPVGNTRQFIGFIDELRFDKVARTAEEIATFYNASAPFFPR